MKEIDMKLARVAQKKHEQEKRKVVRGEGVKAAKLYLSKNEMKQKRIDKAICAILFILLLSVLVIIPLDWLMGGKLTYKGNQEVSAETVEHEQKYIVRYGTVNSFDDNGNMVVITEDGNQWVIIEPPEIETETIVRLLFDSNETITAKDDIIIDITEGR